MLKLLLADWLHADVAAIPIREAVFIDEQNKPAAEEWGHGDEQALHVVASLDGNAIGTARLEADGTISHMAVLKHFRNQGIGSAMVDKFIEVAKKNKFTTVKLKTSRSLEPFFSKKGFTPQGDVFIESGIAQIEMQLHLAFESK